MNHDNHAVPASLVLGRRRPSSIRPAAGMAAAGGLLLSWCISAPQALAVDIVIDGSSTFQTIEGFGTCTSHWTAGKSLGDPVVRQHFSDDLRGSIVRFPIPSDLQTTAVQAPGDITYQHFTFSEGDKQVFDYVQAIHDRDPAIKVFGTVWSPPGWMKSNGKTTNGGSLRRDRMAHFARYLAEVVRYMQEQRHVPIFAISPQNELGFAEPYDSCVYSQPHYAETVAAIGEAFDAEHLTTTMLGPEDMTDFSGRVISFITAIAKVPDAKSHFSIAASHGYVDGVLSAGSADGHNALWKGIEPTGLPLWMTETSGESPAWYPVNAKGKPTAGALTLATKIHNALVYGHCSAWIYWCLVGDIKLNGSAASESLMDLEHPTKKYFASKQFYRWIRPGAVRIQAGPDNQDGVLVSAYDHHHEALTVVLINTAKDERPVHLSFHEARAHSFHCWRSTADEECVAQADVAVADGAAALTLPGLSVVTLTTYDEKDVSLPPQPAH